MIHVIFQMVLPGSLTSDVRNPKKRSHSGSTDREEQTCHYENKKCRDYTVCSN